MLPIQDFDRKYGVAATLASSTALCFVVPVAAATGSDTFYSGAALWDGAGECKISKDGAAFADTDSDPARVGTTSLFTLDLTAAELQCSEAFIIISNAGTTVRDVFLRVRTHLQLGSVDIDAATGQKANTTAFKCTGYQAGHGIQGTGGATGHDIDGILGEMVLLQGTTTAAGTDGTHICMTTTTTGISATNDFYNGELIAIIAGTGAGQSRMIKDFVGATAVAEVDTWTTNPDGTSIYIVIPGPKSWNVSPGAGLTALPTYASSYGALLQFLFQRFAYKRTQTTSKQQMYEQGESTVLCSATVADNGVTQTFSEYADGDV